MPTQTPWIIPVSQLRDVVLCPRKAWLNLHGDEAHRVPSDDSQLLRLATGINHEHAVHAQTAVGLPIEAPTWSEGVEITREAMAQGVDVLINAYLEVTTQIQGVEVTLRGRVDRLERQRSENTAIYAPIEIKHSAKPPRETDLVQLDAYVWMLKQLHGVEPSAQFWTGNPVQIVEHVYDEARLMQNLDTLVTYQQQTADAPPVQKIRHCESCEWRKVCHHEARRLSSLTLILELPKDSIAALSVVGIHTLEQLVALDVAELRKIYKIKSRAERFQAHARAWLEQQPIIYRQIPAVCLGDAWHVDTEYDSAQMVWSIGWSRNNEAAGVVVVAPKQPSRQIILPNGQQVDIVPDADEAWRIFAEVVSQDDAPIFHWAHADKTALDKTAPIAVRHMLQGRFKDIHKLWVASVQLPIRNYSVKDVAVYLGFGWQIHADWFSAYEDYRQWLRHGDDTLLMRVCHYQCDDVLALAHIRRWLIAQV